ncbi:MAG: hypothetical protein Q9208_004623 [Pyrenodesmia sp. 3 TL-2023]
MPSSQPQQVPSKSRRGSSMPSPSLLDSGLSMPLPSFTTTRDKCARRLRMSAQYLFQCVQADESAIDQGHPMMKVIWKPDITKLSDENARGFANHLAHAAKSDHSAVPLNLQKLAEMVAIYAQKNPRIRVLELDNADGTFVRYTPDLLRADTAFPRMAGYSRGYTTAEGQLFVQNIDSSSKIDDSMDQAKINAPGMAFNLIVLPSRNNMKRLEKIVVGKIAEQHKSQTGRHRVVVERGDQGSFNDALVARPSERSAGEKVERVSLSMLASAVLPSGDESHLHCGALRSAAQHTE